jgi:hypothetical protein
MGSFSRPSATDLNDQATMANYLNNQTTSDSGLLKTTASVEGDAQYAATSYNVSDILQGVGAVKDPSDTMMVMNKALTMNLNKIYEANPERNTALLSSAGSNPATTEMSYGQTGFMANNQIDPNWVAGLTTDLNYKAPNATESTTIKLWAKSGYASEGLHLPVANTLKDDVQKHIQSSTLKDIRKHPYFMDRDAQDSSSSSAPIIGADGYVYNWNYGDAIQKTTLPAKTIGAEDPNRPGKAGAFGYLDPKSEQWYISMTWPCDQNTGQWTEIGMTPLDDAIKNNKLTLSSYLGCKILVYNPSNGKAVVTTPGDIGPEPKKLQYNPQTPDKCNLAILSPDTMEYLGISGNLTTKVSIGFVADTWDLGPYVKPMSAAELTGAGGSDTGTGAGGAPKWDGNTGPLGSRDLINSIDEIKYAYSKLRDHPNMWATKADSQIPGSRVGYNEGACSVNGFYKQFTNGHPVDPGKAWIVSGGRSFMIPSLLNFLWVCLESGWIFDYCAGAAGPGGGPSHSAGLAIDFQGFGHVSVGNAYTWRMNWSPYPTRGNGPNGESTYDPRAFTGPPTKNPKQMEIYNIYSDLVHKMATFCQTLPKDIRPYVGAPFDVPNTVVHEDHKPNHMHFEITGTSKGAEKGNKGQLMPDLKR